MKTPWTGGKPNKDWTGSSRTTPSTPHCYRLTAPDKATKSFEFRTTSKQSPFKLDNKDYPLAIYEQDINDHMTMMGLDSIFYVKDPLSDDMLNVITDHSRLFKEHVTRHVLDYQSKYDEYDQTNMTEASTYLMASLDPALKMTIRPFLRTNITAPELWMTIVSKVQAESLQRYENIKKEVENLRVNQYPAENIELYAVAVMERCNELEKARQLPDNMVYTIISALCQSSHEEFRSRSLRRKETVNHYLRSLAGKTPEIRAQMDTDLIYDHRRVLDSALQDYQEFVTAGNWLETPKGGGTTPGLGPSGFYCMNKAELNLLVQSKLTCFNCGKIGHMKTDCPSPPKPADPSATPKIDK